MYNAANDDIHILDRLAVVYRYRRIALTVFVLATAAMMIQGYSNIQVYQARAQILIEDERSTAMLFGLPAGTYVVVAGSKILGSSMLTAYGDDALDQVYFLH